MAAAYRSLPPTSARGPGLTKTQMQRSITDLQNFHGRSWVLTVPCTETLILGCIHLLVINSNRMTATRCGSSLSLSSPHQCPGPWPDENADAKKHHRPAKLSWSVGGAHGKWVTVSESEWEWAKPDWCLQSRQRISHWDPSSWKHWNGPAQWSIGACPLESRVVASWQRRCIGAPQTCAIFNHGDAACNQKPC